MAFNPSLSYFVERLSGFSTNVFRLESANKSTATSSDIISFDLPANAILNLRSFTVHFQADCNETAAAGARLPAGIEGLFERVEVIAGGITLSQGTNFYNVLRNAKDCLMGSHVNSVLGHPAIVREKSYVDGNGCTETTATGAAITTTENEGYPTANNQAQFAVDYWDGFLGSAEPRLLDSSLLPDLKVRIYMATDNVLSSSASVALTAAGFQAVGTAAGKYKLNNIYATIECVNLADATYDSMINDMLQNQGYIEVPFKSYYTFNDSHGGSTRWSVASQSVDRVWSAWRIAGYNAQLKPLVVNGYKTVGAFVSAGEITGSDLDGTGNNTAGRSIGQDMGKSQYDIGSVVGLNNNCERYIGQYFNFVEPAATALYQLQLNGANIPQAKMRSEPMYQISKNSTQGYHMEHQKSLDQYKNNFFVQAVRLNLPDSEYSRLISGLDTRAVNLQGSLNTDNVTGSPNVILFVECTASLKIGAGRAIEIIH